MIVLSGGSTPLGLFKRLKQPEYQQKILWQFIHIFWADERCVPADNPQSNYGQAYRLLLSLVPLPGQNIHPIIGSLSPQEASKKYDITLRSFSKSPEIAPVFDWVLLGMGTDGHTASLFPGQSEPSDINRLSFPAQVQYEDRPAERVSLTSNTLNHSRAVVFLVTGESKADALKLVLEGKPDPLALPAQRIQPKFGNITWLIDPTAASQLNKT